MKKTVLALTFILTLFSAVFCTQVISLVEANPDWNYTGADWKHVATITGTGDQEITVFVPNQAHTQIYGNCTSGSGTAQLGVYDDFGGSVYNYTSGGFHNFQGGTSFSSRRGPANVSVVIRTLNILNYTLVVEYDAAAPTTSTTPTPFPLPSLSTSQAPSPSPSQEQTDATLSSEPFPTTLVATASGVSATLVCLGLVVYFKKRNGGKNLRREQP